MKYLKLLTIIFILIPNVAFAQLSSDDNRRIIIDEEELRTPSQVQQEETNRDMFYIIAIIGLLVIAGFASRSLISEKKKK